MTTGSRVLRTPAHYLPAILGICEWCFLLLNVADLGHSGQSPVEPQSYAPTSAQGWVTTRAPPTRPASELSALGRAFIEYATLRDVQQSFRFVTSNPKVLDEANYVKRYSTEAINALIGGDSARAKNCVEKWVMVEHCKGLGTKDTTLYFQRLLARNPTLSDRFDKDFARFWKACIDAAEPPGQKSRADPPAEQRHANEVAGISDQLGQTRLGTTPTAQGLIGRQRGDDGLGGGYGLRRDERRRAGGDVGGDDDDDDDDTDDAQSRRRSPPRTDRHGPGRPAHAPPQPAPRGSLPSEISEPSFQGTRGEEEKLDGRYYRRDARDAGKILRVGRVFAILRHEEYTGPELGQLKWRSRTKQNVEVFSHICRMVVVKECHGFVWAIPINTYIGKGVGKRGFNQTDIDAHAIIYMDGMQPARVTGEPSMKKTPIKVMPSQRETLDIASRVNFSKPHSIDHNVKFMDIGKVAQTSMAYFTTYWKQYC